jgi:putative ABC transport system permease protein
MRALGSPPRRLRRRLRRLALGIAAAAVLIGVPLGVVISNVIARLVLEEFVGLTPEPAVSVPVMVGSALFALVGARVVSARAARRVTRLPLADTLRDRDGSPFGRRPTDRLLARVPTGRLLDRAAIRSGWRHRSRSLATVGQITAAIAALMIVTSMATTVDDFNRSQWDQVNWASRTFLAGPGLDIDASVADGDPRSETAIEVVGRTEGWEVDVFGIEPHSAMLDHTTSDGRWLDRPGEAVVSTGFAERTGIAPGDRIDVVVASGTVDYRVVGLHPDRGRSVIVERDELATDLGAPGRANFLMSLDAESTVRLDGLTSTDLLADLVATDDGGREAIVLIFGAIGLVVVSVAGLAVAAGLAVDVHERRHEFAAVRAIGGRRRHVFRAVATELIPLAAVGIAAGVGLGYAGSLAVVESFETSNAVEIGLVYATGAIPAAAAVVIIGSLGLAALALRRATRHPVAVTLRGAA